MFLKLIWYVYDVELSMNANYLDKLAVYYKGMYENYWLL